MGTIKIPDSNATYNYEGNISIDGTTTLTGAITATGAVTAAVGVQSAAVSREATSDGSGTGTIADGTSVVTVTVATDANDIIILPTPTPGTVVWLLSGAVAFELRSSAPATVGINGGTGASAESAVLATDLLSRCVCVDATTWIVTHFAADGTESAADAAA